MSDFAERDYWLAFSNCHGIGSGRFHTLLTHFGSAKAAWFASVSELKQSGIGPLTAERVATFRNSYSIENYHKRLEKTDVSFITKAEKNYPSLLAQSSNPPFVLYVKGNISLLQSQQCLLAVVGTRKITGYGKQVTELLVSDLVSAGCVIVSGLAMGVDAVAHQATLTAHGKTIAVLGSGVDYCTPRENLPLYTKIIESGGVIISETPLGQMPNKGSFPMRNRIIAGIAAGVLVTEGAEDSGSLITAKKALENHRPVFAVPGPITSTVSQGPLVLLQQGAIMVTQYQDILKALHMTTTGTNVARKITGDTPEEQKIIETLTNESLSFDELVKKTQLVSANLATMLSLMEIKGIIFKTNDGSYTIQT